MKSIRSLSQFTLPNRNRLTKTPSSSLTGSRQCSISHPANPVPARINIKEWLQELDLYKHVDPFVHTDDGYYPRSKLGPGDLVPMECPNFDKMLEAVDCLSRFTDQVPTGLPVWESIAKDYIQNGYSIVRTAQRQTLTKEAGLNRSKLVSEIKTLLTDSPITTIAEVFAKPRLDICRFTINCNDLPVVEFVERDFKEYPELQKVVTTWTSLLQEKANHDNVDLSRIAISVRKSSYQNQKQAIDKGIKSWLIPHDDRDVKPYKYSVFAPIQLHGLRSFNNVISKDGTILAAAGPTDMVLLDNRQVLHDAIYTFDPLSPQGFRFFMNISAY